MLLAWPRPMAPGGKNDNGRENYHGMDNRIAFLVQFLFKRGYHFCFGAAPHRRPGNKNDSEEIV